MEPKYINRYTITLDLVKEWAKHPVGRSAIQRRQKSLLLRITGIVLSCIIAASGILLQEYYMVVMGAAFLALFLLRLFVIPQRILKKQYELMLKSQNRSQLTRTISFSDQIIIEDGKTTTRYAYSELLRTTEDEKYFYLFINEDVVLRVPKDGFVLGAWEDFRHFIDTVVSNPAH